MSQVLRKEKKKKKKKEVKFEVKEEYFIRNGGILLEKQIALTKGQNMGSGQLKIFSINDIERATNGFDPDLILASVLGTIYKGTLEDRIVAIRAPVNLVPKPQLVDLFLTEASIAVVMNHNNMVKFYGCCLETSIPVLVYEFLPNQSLFKHLHGGNLAWAYRLRVASDISYALSYMHNALAKPLVHRNVQSHVILLDDSFHAKLSNFGNAVLITPGEESSQRWPVLGTPGYIDPEYKETRKVTDKCDVYTFGVLMLEILTRRQPLMMAKEGMDLVDVFVSAVGNNSMTEMIDKEVLEQGRRDEIERFARLALKCTAKKGIERPTMIEVVSELWLIQGPQTQANLCALSELQTE